MGDAHLIQSATTKGQNQMDFRIVPSDSERSWVVEFRGDIAKSKKLSKTTTADQWWTPISSWSTEQAATDAQQHFERLAQ